MKTTLLFLALLAAGTQAYCQSNSNPKNYTERLEAIFDVHNNANATTCAGRTSEAQQLIAAGKMNRTINITGNVSPTREQAMFADVLRRDYNITTKLVKTLAVEEDATKGCFEKVMDDAIAEKLGKRWMSEIAAKVAGLQKSLSQEELDRLYPFPSYKLSTASK